MKLNAPKKTTFYIAVLFFVLSLLGYFVAFLSGYQLILAYVGFVVLAAGTYLKGF